MSKYIRQGAERPEQELRRIGRPPESSGRDYTGGQDAGQRFVLVRLAMNRRTVSHSAENYVAPIGLAGLLEGSR